MVVELSGVEFGLKTRPYLSLQLGANQKTGIISDYMCSQGFSWRGGGGLPQEPGPNNLCLNYTLCNFRRHTWQSVKPMDY